MNNEQRRQSILSKLQQEIQEARQNQTLLALPFQKRYSNTTRSKSYNKGCSLISCGKLNRILSIDLQNRKIQVEPRVTMEALVKATLSKGFIVPVIPEFKRITVGGALMGAAAESSSHRWGIFHDTCTSIEILDGAGHLLSLSPSSDSDLFYGLSGSYGTLGLLTKVELNLIPIKQSVKLHYHFFSNATQALKKLTSLIGQVDFLDGVLLSPTHHMIIEGTLTDEKPTSLHGQWYISHLKNLLDGHEEILSLDDYLFRYDLGAFWTGVFLFSFPFLKRYIKNALLKIPDKMDHFTNEELILYKKSSYPGPFLSLMSSPFMNSQTLWSLLHRAEKWIQDRLIIQDLCIPIHQASPFLTEILKDPGIFPIWVCPIKGTATPQFLAPHLGNTDFINFGLYGLPALAQPMKEIVRKLEKATCAHGGRKVLYSRSFYSEENFWEIYPFSSYEALRQKTHASGIWRTLVEKVLSE